MALDSRNRGVIGDERSQHICRCGRRTGSTNLERVESSAAVRPGKIKLPCSTERSSCKRSSLNGVWRIKVCLCNSSVDSGYHSIFVSDSFHLIKNFPNSGISHILPGGSNIPRNRQVVVLEDRSTTGSRNVSKVFGLSWIEVPRQQRSIAEFSIE